MVHASIAGASALVLPDGSLQAQAPLFEVASIRATVPVVSGSTPAASVAPVVSGLLAAALVGLLLWRVGQVVVGRRTTR